MSSELSGDGWLFTDDMPKRFAKQIVATGPSPPGTTAWLVQQKTALKTQKSKAKPSKVYKFILVETGEELSAKFYKCTVRKGRQCAEPRGVLVVEGGGLKRPTIIAKSPSNTYKAFRPWSGLKPGTAEGKFKGDKWGRSSDDSPMSRPKPAATTDGQRLMTPTCDHLFLPAHHHMATGPAIHQQEVHHDQIIGVLWATNRQNGRLGTAHGVHPEM